MTGKEYLEEARDLYRHIKCQNEKLAHIRALSRSIPSQLGREFIAPNSSVGVVNGVENKIIDTAKKADDLEQQILFDKAVYLQKFDECNEYIKQIRGHMLAIVLQKHYLLDKDFTKIAVEEDYSYIRILQFHQKALKKFERLYIIICQSVV